MTEVKLDKEFLAGIVEKLPPNPFEKKGQYRGKAHSYRLLAIDSKRRRFLAACQLEGEFRPPVTGPVSERISRSEDHTQGMRKFRFEVTAGVNIEAGPDSLPRFRVDVEEVKKAELEGIAGLLAKLLGKFFDEMVTQIADGRASLLSQKLNSEVLKRGRLQTVRGILRDRLRSRPGHPSFRPDALQVRRRRGLCVIHASTWNGPALPLVRPPGWLSRVHSQPGWAGPTQPGQRRHRLLRS